MQESCACGPDGDFEGHALLFAFMNRGVDFRGYLHVHSRPACEKLQQRREGWLLALCFVWFNYRFVDVQVTKLLQGVEFVFIPLTNPDGYEVYIRM